MTNLSRVTGKIFGETASTSNTPKEIGQFGSAKAGTYNATGDVATIQNLTAWSNGWIDAVTPSQQFPSLPEMTGVHKVLSYQENYLLQKGVAEWDSGTTYYTGDLCKGVGNGKLYKSLQDSNLNNALTDTAYWIEWVADTNLSNITTTGTITGASWALPSDTYEEVTLGASAATYTAPANGYYVAVLGRTASNSSGYAYMELINSTNKMQSCINPNGQTGGTWNSIYIPVQKGDIVTYNYAYATSILTPPGHHLYFIYAQGSESEYTP